MDVYSHLGTLVAQKINELCDCARLHHHQIMLFRAYDVQGMAVRVL